MHFYGVSSMMQKKAVSSKPPCSASLIKPNKNACLLRVSLGGQGAPAGSYSQSAEGWGELPPQTHLPPKETLSKHALLRGVINDAEKGALQQNALFRIIDNTSLKYMFSKGLQAPGVSDEPAPTRAGGHQGNTTGSGQG
jgi:hypothetical protein